MLRFGNKKEQINIPGKEGGGSFWECGLKSGIWVAPSGALGSTHDP